MFRQQMITGDDQSETYTASLLTYADEVPAAHHSHLPAHPAHCMLVAHDGKALIMPTAKAQLAASGAADKKIARSQAVWESARSVWWRMCDHCGHTDPQARIWGAPLTASSRVCDGCGHDFESTHALLLHQMQSGCCPGAP